VGGPQSKTTISDPPPPPLVKGRKAGGGGGVRYGTCVVDLSADLGRPDLRALLSMMRLGI
jgi:hypothetical protein